MLDCVSVLPRYLAIFILVYLCYGNVINCCSWFKLVMLRYLALFTQAYICYWSFYLAFFNIGASYMLFVLILWLMAKATLHKDVKYSKKNQFITCCDEHERSWVWYNRGQRYVLHGVSLYTHSLWNSPGM